MRTRAAILATMLVMALVIGFVPGVRAEDPPDWAFEQTPPRLSLTDGQVSFWRPGARDWTQAQINTPLAAGDVLATGSPGTLELQMGARAFVRAWWNTQLSLANQEPGFIQFTLMAGSAVFDLRALEPGSTVEVSTPNAVVTIAQAGYYRVNITGEHSRIMTRRGGRATVTLANGQSVAVTPSEEIVVEGIAAPQLAAYAAPPLDEWDRWNYVRTERLLDAVSARYVAPGTYGLADLDPYGTWRVVPVYGTVWVPTGVPVGWAPYTTGSWILDPIYGWTWVDTAPWGWAPYHYGRWCFVDGYWAWAPGPVVVRPVYSPALVVFFDAPTLVIRPGWPVFGWVALGWGEPVVPWWGRRGFRHEPSWHGWGGPRVVNNVVINNTTIVNVTNINIYRNTSVPHAVVAVDRARFGQGPIASARVVQVDAQNLRPLPTGPEISSTSASFTPSVTRGVRPPEENLKRPVVATRPAHRERPAGAGGGAGSPQTVSTPPERIVTVPRQQPQQAEQAGDGLPRPSFGRGTPERPMTDRKPSPAPPRQSGASQGPVAPRPPEVSVPPGRSTPPGTGSTAAPSLPTPPPGQSAGEKGPGPGGPPAMGRAPMRPAPTAPQMEPPGPPGQSVREKAPGPSGPPAMGRAPMRPAPTAPQMEPPGPPGQSVREKAPGPSGPPAMGRAPGGASPVTRQVEPQNDAGRGRAGGPPMAGPGPGTPRSPSDVEVSTRPGKRGDAPPAVTNRPDGAPAQAVLRPGSPRGRPAPLPGEPANRLAPGRSQESPSEDSKPEKSKR